MGTLAGVAGGENLEQVETARTPTAVRTRLEHQKILRRFDLIPNK
jgi:hypothetical protein